MKPTPFIRWPMMLSCIALVAQAQTAPATSPASKTAADLPGDAPIELSPFTVKADSDKGYLAGNTLAGNRLNTSLRDTAASISVMTAQLIQDLGAFNMTEALDYGNNVQLERDDAGTFGDSPAGNPTYQFYDTYRVRGQTATVARNYFAWMLPIDTYNVERIEEARGPNSVLFGVGSAGGVLSASTKQANLSKSFYNGQAGVGSYGTHRESIDLNQTVLNGRLGVRFNAVYSHSANYRQYAFDDQNRADLTATYIVTPNSRLRAEVEIGHIHQDVAYRGNILDGGAELYASLGRPTFPTTVAANPGVNGIGALKGAAHITYIQNDNKLINEANSNIGTNYGDMLGDPKFADRSINVAGAGGLRDSPFTAISAFFEQKLGQNTFLELGYNHQDYGFQAYQPAGTSNRLDPDPDQFQKDGTKNPHAGGFFLEGNWIRRRREERGDSYRATFSTEHDFGKWGNYRLGAMFEFDMRKYASRDDVEAWAGAPYAATSPESAANMVYRRNYVTEGNWGSYYVSSPATMGLINMTEAISGRALSSTWYPQGSLQDTPSQQGTGLVGVQGRYFDDRLMLGFGYRRDSLQTYQRNVIRDPATFVNVLDWAHGQKFHWFGDTRTYSAVYHLTKHIDLLANDSSNIALPNTVRVLPYSAFAAPAKGTGQDIGIAFSLFRDRLYIRATNYKSSQKGAADFRLNGDISAGGPTSQILGALVQNGLITQAIADAHLPNASGGTYDRVSDGWEFSATGSILPHWKVQLNYSITRTIETNIAPEVTAWMNQEFAFYNKFNTSLVAANGETILQNEQGIQADLFNAQTLSGVSEQGDRKYKGSIFTSYDFTQRFIKGLTIGAGYKAQSRVVAGRDTSVVNGPLLYGNSYWLADALIAYKVPAVRWVKELTLRLNVSNVFDNTDPLVTRIRDPNPDKPTEIFNPAGRAIQRWSIQTPRTWRLSADIRF